MPQDPFADIMAQGPSQDPFAAEMELTPAEIEKRATYGSFAPRDSGAWKTIQQHGTDFGFTAVAGYDPTGKKHNIGSQHDTGDAVDFRVRDKKPEDVDAFINNMKSKGFYVRDERTRPPGQKVWGGPHVHVAVPRGKPLLEAVRSANPILDAMMSGAQPKTPQKPVQTVTGPSPSVFDTVFQDKPLPKATPTAPLLPSEPKQAIQQVGKNLAAKQKRVSGQVMKTLGVLDSTMMEVPAYSENRDKIRMALTQMASDGTPLEFSTVAPLLYRVTRPQGMPKHPEFAPGIAMTPSLADREQIEAGMLRDMPALGLLKEAFNLGPENDFTVAGNKASGARKQTAIDELARRYLPGILPGTDMIPGGREGQAMLIGGAISQTAQMPEEARIMLSTDGTPLDRAGAFANFMMGSIVADPTDLVLHPVGAVFKNVGKFLAEGADPARAVAEAMKGYNLPDHLVVQVRQAADEAMKALPSGEAKAPPARQIGNRAIPPGTKPTPSEGRPLWGQPETAPTDHNGGLTNMVDAEDYRGQHQPPRRTDDVGAPLHDLTGVYPADFYGPNGLRYYGDGQPFDAESYSAMTAVRGKPNATVTVYRAVPFEKPRDLQAERAYMLKNGSRAYEAKYGRTVDEMYNDIENPPPAPVNAIDKINPGDWVTLSRSYAKQHGESNLNGKFKILSKKVKAAEVISPGDSIHEFGYDPLPATEKPTTKSTPVAENAHTSPSTSAVSNPAEALRGVNLSDEAAMSKTGWRKVPTKGYNGNAPALIVQSPDGTLWQWKQNFAHGGAEPWQNVGKEPYGYTEIDPTPPPSKYTIVNHEHLPRGTGAKYVIGIEGEGGTLVAARWARTKDAKLGKNEILTDLNGAEVRRGSLVSSNAGSRNKPGTQAGAETGSAGQPISPDLGGINRAEPTAEPPVNSPEIPVGSDAPSASPDVASPQYGESNKLVTKDQAKEILDKYKRANSIGPEIIPDLAKLGLYHLEAGARTFADWSAKMLEDLGDQVKPHLFQIWRESHREMGFHEPLESPTGIAHAEVDRLRQEIGLPERKSAAKTDAELWDEAQALKDNAEVIAFRHLNDKNPLPEGKWGNKEGGLSDAETIALGSKLDDLKKELNAASQAQDQAKWDAAWVKASVIADALDKSGTETGRALRARRFLGDQQNDVFSITRRMEASKQGVPLTPEERALAEASAEGDKADVASVEAARQAEAEAKAEGVLQNHREDPKPRGKDLEAIRARREWAAKSMREEIAKGLASPVSMILGAGGPGGAAPDVFKFRIALREYAYSLIDEGIVHLEDVVKRITHDFPELDRDRVISELAAPTKDVTTKAEATIKKAELIREAKKIDSAIKENKSSLTEAGKRSAAIQKRVEKAQKRLADLRRMQKEGIQIVKTKDGDVPVPSLVKQYEEEVRKLEQELTIVPGAASKTKEARRMEEIQKALHEIDEKFKNNDFRKPTKKEVQMSQARRQAEEKLRQRRADLNEIIRSMEPKTFAQGVENVTSNLQLMSPQGRVKDVLSNAFKAVGESVQALPRRAYMKGLEKLGDGWKAMGVNPGKGFHDLFPETYFQAVSRRYDNVKKGKDIAMNAKYGRVEGFGHVMAGVSDMPFSELYHRAYLADWAATQAASVGAKGDKEIMRELIANAPSDILDEAEEWSRRMTFNNSNIAADIKRALDGVWEKQRRSKDTATAKFAIESGNILTNFLTRYGKVIGNVAANVVRTSPAGLAESSGRTVAAILNARKGAPLPRYEALKISDAFAKGTVGTVGWGLGYLAYQSKVSEDELFPGEKALVKGAQWALGREMQSVDKNGKKTSSYWFDPGNARQIATGMPLAIMLGYQTAWDMSKRGKSANEAAPVALLNVLAGQMLDQPLVSGANRFSDDMRENGALDAIMSLGLNRIIPGGLTETAKEIDSVDYYKQHGKPAWYGMVFDRPARVDKGNIWTRLLQEAMRKTPGVRGYLKTGAKATGR